LPLVKCRQCGAVNDTKSASYPFCVGCEDNLARCGDCRWFSDEALICTEPDVADVFETDENAAPPCGRHVPRDTVVVRHKRQRLLLGIGIAAAAFALLYGMVRLVLQGSSDQGLARLELTVEADYRGAQVGVPYTITAEIYNPSNVRVTDVQLKLSNDFLGKFDLREVLPAPTRWSDGGEWRVLIYPEINPLERQTVALHLVPKGSGVFTFAARLDSAECKYHGMASLPVAVSKGAPGGPGAGGDR